MRGLTGPLCAVLLLTACSPFGDEAADAPATAPSERQTVLSDDGGTEGVLAGGTLYLSGILPPDSSAPVADQTRAAMERMGQVLGKAGLDHGHVVSCHVHLADMESYSEMNAVYGSFFDEGAYPARTTVEVPGIPGGAGVLLMCIAHADRSEISVVSPPAGETPPAMGPYSSAVRAGRTLYVSGQGGRDPATGQLADSTGGQARTTLQTIGAILAAGGLAVDNAAMVSSYVPPAGDGEEVARVFDELFPPGGAPSRVPVSLSRLPGDILVEITFVAVDDPYINRLFMHDQAPTAGSSPAALTGGVLYASSMTGQGETFQEAAADALSTQLSLLQLASMDWQHVARMTVYLADVAVQNELMAVIGETLPAPLPAISVMQTRHPDGSRIAVDLIAVQ